jgi:exosortase
VSAKTAETLPARFARAGPVRHNLRVTILIAGIAALVIPTLLSLAKQHWSTSNGVHVPLILVTGIWLIWRDRANIHFGPGSISNWWLALLAPLLLIYAYGRAFGLLGTESAALYLVLVLLALFYWGPQVMGRLWFAIGYLAFLIKPPYGVITDLTLPLKIAISEVSVDLLSGLGYPVARSGVVIQMAQYELMIAQACAGLSSLFTLLALGLLYVHLTRPTDRVHAASLLLAIVPIAMLANLLRVILLLLMTYYLGDGVAQSFAHDAAGIFTFSLSMLCMFLFDSFLNRVRIGAHTT